MDILAADPGSSDTKLAILTDKLDAKMIYFEKKMRIGSSSVIFLGPAFCYGFVTGNWAFFLGFALLLAALVLLSDRIVYEARRRRGLTGKAPIDLSKPFNYPGS